MSQNGLISRSFFIRQALTLCLYAAAFVSFLSIPITAASERASLVIEVDSGLVLHAKNERLPSYPASLTKLMTLYLIFEAMKLKQLSPTDQLKVSAAAASSPPVRLDLQQDQTITLEEVILAMIVRSANDAAVVVAERIAGSEQAFTNLMNAKAKTLGMSDTAFHNASGLPRPNQITSARDMAILARALITDYPQHYSYFSARTFQYRGKTFNMKNNFAESSSGIQVIKTGFTCNAGYNLVASIDTNGQRLIGVILGARNLHKRNAQMLNNLRQAAKRKNVDKALTINDPTIEVSQGTGLGPNKQAIADVCTRRSNATAFLRSSGWGLVVGVKKQPNAALALSRKTMRQYPKALKNGRPVAIPFMRGVLLNRAAITDLQKRSATSACQQLRNREQYCIVLDPKLLRRHVANGRMAMKRPRVTYD